MTKEKNDLKFLRDLVKNISVGIKTEIEHSREEGKLFKVLPPVSHKLSPVVFVATGEEGKRKYPIGLSRSYNETIGIKAEKLKNIHVLVVFTTNDPINDKLIVDYPGRLIDSRIRAEYPIEEYEAAWRKHISVYLNPKKKDESQSSVSSEVKDEPKRLSNNKFKFSLSPEDLNKAIDDSQQSNEDENDHYNDDIPMDFYPHDIDRESLLKLVGKSKQLIDIQEVEKLEDKIQKLQKKLEDKEKNLEDKDRVIEQQNITIKNLTPSNRSPEMQPCMDSCASYVSNFPTRSSSSPTITNNNSQLDVVSRRNSYSSDSGSGSKSNSSNNMNCPAFDLDNVNNSNMYTLKIGSSSSTQRLFNDLLTSKPQFMLEN
jgi:hypothetical protein